MSTYFKLPSDTFSSTPTSRYPKPSFFVVRAGGAGGAIVPLIPYDELPSSITLVGISRSLELQETIGMLNLGLARSTGCTYALEDASKVKSPGTTLERKNVATRNVVQERGIDGGSTTIAKSLCLPLLNTLTTNVNILPASTKFTTTNTNTGITAPPSTPHTRSSTPIPTGLDKLTCLSTPKIPSSPRDLCRHWLHHGSCKWMPRCRHEHRMPTTLRGLAAHGLNGWPNWWVRVGGVDLEHRHYLREVDASYVRNGYDNKMEIRPMALLPTIESKEGCCGMCSSGQWFGNGHGRGKGHNVVCGATVQDKRGRGVAGARSVGKRGVENNAEAGVRKGESLIERTQQLLGEERVGKKEGEGGVQNERVEIKMSEIERKTEDMALQKSDAVEDHEIVERLVDV